MKKFMKKLATFALAGSFLLGAVGCGGKGGGGKDSDNVVKGLPDYSADESTKKVMIGGYCAPPHGGIVPPASSNPNFITQESYNDIAACDMDYVLTLYEQGNTEDNRLALDYAKNAGVKILVRWDAITSFGDSTADAMNTALDGIINHDACWGIFAKDEPHANYFNSLAKGRKVFAEMVEKFNYTDKYYYVNLFPNYATSEQWGTKTYREYVNQYCAKVGNNMIIEDHYPLGYNDVDYSVNAGYLSNIEIIQQYAQAYNMEHWEYIPGEKLDASSKKPDYYDFRFMFYTLMCYGVTNMQYFCYWSPFSGTEADYTAFIAPDGSKTQRYTDGQKINKEIHKFDHVYMNFAKNHKGTMTFLGKNNASGMNRAFDMLLYSITETPRISKVECDEDTIIGTYKDGDGRDGFMIANYTVPGKRISNKVTVDFKNTDAVVYYREGEYNLAEVKNGRFEIELGAGEGVFAIPVKY